jgi:hypothetical protein
VLRWPARAARRVPRGPLYPVARALRLTPSPLADRASDRPQSNISHGGGWDPGSWPAPAASGPRLQDAAFSCELAAPTPAARAPSLLLDCERSTLHRLRESRRRARSAPGCDSRRPYR